jgi:flagellar biosynthesis protein FliR
VTLDVGMAAWLSLLLAGLRTVAFLVVAPPFSTKVVPAAVKVALAVALTLPLAGRLQATVGVTDLPTLLSRAAMQVFVGTVLGFACYLVFAAVQAAGDLIDLFGGFSLASAYDPLSMTSNSVFGRFHQLLATTLLFALNGHLLVLNGFLLSFKALPLDAGVDLGSLDHLLTHGLGDLVLSALQIAGPLVAALFLSDVSLGLLTKVSPQLNAFSLGFPLKILVTLLLFGLTLPLLPHAVEATTDSMLKMLGSVHR